MTKQMTKTKLKARVLELFPDLETEGWRWDKTEAGEPLALIRMTFSFTGLANGDLLLCTPIPNSGQVGVYRIRTDNHYVLERLENDPFATRPGRLN